MSELILVPISGGKDSQVCLELAVSEFGRDNVRGLFCDTQFEHPLTYKHIENMREMYGVRIDTVTGGSVVDKIYKHKRFPGGGARFCTEELKIWETKRYLKEEMVKFDSIQVWYGMRSDESPAREKRYRGKLDTDLYFPHEVLKKYPKYLGKGGVRFRLPIIDWSKDEVFKQLDGRQNPLYQNFDRVGCFPCLAAGDGHKEKAFAFDDFGKEQFRKVIMIGQEIGKNIFEGKKARARNPGCSVCSI